MKLNKNCITKWTLISTLAKQTEKYDTYYRSDGETYAITTDNNGEICIGETWSPENSMTGKLIKNAIKIYSIGNGNSCLKLKLKRN
jgi:hypothetical protein